MSDLNLKAEQRNITGRKVSQLRREGLVPVVVYGAISAPINLQVAARDLERTLHAGGASQVVSVAVAGGSKHNVLIKSIQREPVSHSLMHADFYAINMNEKQHVSVSLVASGKASGMAAGLMFYQPHEMLRIEALPADIPAEIVMDIEALTLETPIHVRDLPVVKGVAYLDDPDEVVFSLITTRAGEAETTEEEAEEGEIEPEVVKRGKQSDEDED
jgi:large subunit ribosomal protein L25